MRGLISSRGRVSRGYLSLHQLQRLCFSNQVLFHKERLNDFLLTPEKSNLLFHLEKDGTERIEGLHKAWSSLEKDIEKYGTADPIKQKRLSDVESLAKSLKDDIFTVESRIKELNPNLEHQSQVRRQKIHEIVNRISMDLYVSDHDL